MGDEIALDDLWKGRVARIGLKTTRIRAPGGDLLVIPNSALASSKVRNISRLHERKVTFANSVLQLEQTIAIPANTVPEAWGKWRAVQQVCRLPEGRPKTSGGPKSVPPPTQ